MILKCPNCNSRIKSRSAISDQQHSCPACRFQFIPSHHIDICYPYNHSEFVKAINEGSIILLMDDESANSLLTKFKAGRIFCRTLTLLFYTPWIGLLCSSLFLQLDPIFNFAIFVFSCIYSIYTRKYFLKLKINRVANLLIDDKELYAISQHKVDFIIRDNPNFKD